MNDNLKNALFWIIGILNKHNISYVISGGFSSYLYGSQRPINDIDIDIKNNDMSLIINEAKEYITYSHQRYKNKKWDLDLITLNYNGQEIDISGGTDLKLYDDYLQKWLDVPTDFTKVRKIIFDGLELNVIEPKNLLDYKLILDQNDEGGIHQKIDIEALKKFILKESTY